MNLVMVLLGLLGGSELIIIGLVFAILFGGKRIPELMKSLGTGVKELRKATVENEITKDIEDIYSDISDLKNGFKDVSSPVRLLKRDKK